MQLIGGAVGDGAANATGDVALVQAILLKITRPAAPANPPAPPRAAGPYLSGYSGTYDAATGAAIRAFQSDRGLAAPASTPGRVAPNDPTWGALVAAVPAAFANLRVFPGHRTVWIQATAAQLQAKLAAVVGLTFTPAFRHKVNDTINRMFTDHGIAIGVDPQGDRRTFQQQYDLRTSGRGVTNAGPGESNHNFGGAADLGFAGLRWLRPNGDVVENENPWLRQMDSRGAAETTPFWDALRAAGIASGAFRGPIGDRPHIQNWDDAGVSMAVRLAELLTRSGTMRWSGRRGAYSCDLGLGGALVPVGNAVQIWARNATITADVIDRLRGLPPLQPGAAAGRPAPQGAAPQPARPAPPPLPGAPRPPAAGAPPRATPGDVTAMQQELRRQFDRADANWQAWTAR
jgi:peptidoglycan hydrolase-like protein with peptidoglycan-binding domain